MRAMLFIAGIFLPVILLANTILINGKIYTVNPKQLWAEAIVVENGFIKYVGSSTIALTYQNRDSKIFDLDRKFVMPGIIDAHTHTAIAALLLNQGINLLEAKGKKAILQTIQRYVDSTDEEVISGFGFYPYILGQHGPTAKQLDDISEDKKIFLVSNNGHSAWVNSKAMTFLNITADTKDPLPGMHYYTRDSQGKPSGFLVEGEAFWPHFEKLNIATKKSFYKALKDFLPKLSKQGITAIFDAGIPSVERRAFQALLALEKEKNLPVRYFGSHYIVSEKDAITALKTFKRYVDDYNSPLLNISSVKFCNDNSDDDNFAIQFDTNALAQYLDPLIENGVDVMIHTSHDKSVNQSLDAIQRLKKKYSHSRSRIALAHVNMVRDSDFQRFKELDIIANIQPFNAQGGGYYDYRYMLYEDWEDQLVRFKHFYDTGIVVSASSDFPACNTSLDKCSPFDSMQIAITRQAPTLDHTSPVLANAKEKLSVKQIIEAFTINAAYQLHQEKYLGSLEVGKKADLIVLNQNLFATSKKSIHKTKVDLTMMNGEIVYERTKGM